MFDHRAHDERVLDIRAAGAAKVQQNAACGSAVKKAGVPAQVGPGQHAGLLDRYVAVQDRAFGNQRIWADLATRPNLSSSANPKWSFQPG